VNLEDDEQSRRYNERQARCAEAVQNVEKISASFEPKRVLLVYLHPDGFQVRPADLMISAQGANKEPLPVSGVVQLFWTDWVRTVATEQLVDLDDTSWQEE
jgi:hypothetical protein